MGLGLALTFSLNLILLYDFHPKKNPISGIRLSLSKHFQSNVDRRGKGDCPDFGCPIYPAELTPYLHELLEEIFVSQTRPNNFTFGGSNFALLTQTGKSHFLNQDRAVLISPFTTSATREEPSFLLGVFDGHGRQGHIVADYIARDLPERLAKELNSLTEIDDQAIVKALNKTVVEVDIYAPPNFLLGGSTATVTLRRGSKLYIANTGDSQTMLVSLPNATLLGRSLTQEDATIEYITRHDKASLPDEYARITALNGTIHIDPKTNDSRVIVRSDAARETIMLAMSRSLGDWEWKAVGVTAEPIIDIIDLANYPNSFLIAASDGFFDMRRNQFYAKQFSESFHAGSLHPLFQSWEVFKKITPQVQKGYRDDMTAIVMKL
jgi:serine/threonine protein phosphatase PrpC